MNKTTGYIFGFVIMFVFSYVIFFFLTGFSEGPIGVWGFKPIIITTIFLYVFGIIGYKFKKDVLNKKKKK